MCGYCIAWDGNYKWVDIVTNNCMCTLKWHTLNWIVSMAGVGCLLLAFGFEWMNKTRI